MSPWGRWRAHRRQVRDLMAEVSRLRAANTVQGTFLQDARAKHIAAELAGEKLAEQLATIRRIAADQSRAPAVQLARIMAALMEGEAPEAGGDRG